MAKVAQKGRPKMPTHRKRMHRLTANLTAPELAALETELDRRRAEGQVITRVALLVRLAMDRLGVGA